MHLTEAFSNQLTARCQALHLILNSLYVEVVTMMLFKQFLYLLIWTFFEGLHVKTYRIYNGRDFLASPYIIIRKGRYRFWIHAGHYTFDNPLLNRTFSRYLVYVRGFICTISWHPDLAPNHMMVQLEGQRRGVCAMRMPTNVNNYNARIYKTGMLKEKS